MFENLSALPDSVIIERLDSHIKREREETEQVIRHLAEVDSRKLVPSLGYSSLFDYLTRGCGYSEPSACRRIEAARAIRRLPEALDCLKKGELNLSTVGVIAKALGKGRDQEVLASVRGKTFEQAKKAVAAFLPVSENVVRERIVPVTVAPKTASSESEKQSLLCFDRGAHSGETADSPLYLRCDGASSADHCEEPFQRHLVSFSVDDDFMALLTRAKELSFRGKKDDARLEKVLRKALEAYLSLNDPKEREARRKARRELFRERREKRDRESLDAGSPALKASPKLSKPDSSCAEGAQADLKGLPVLETRAVPRALRDAVLCRDEHRCTFVSESGNRCGSRSDLEVDHTVPRALGGKNTIENLRTLCSAHNLHAAREVFGRSYVEGRISRSRKLC